MPNMNGMRTVRGGARNYQIPWGLERSGVQPASLDHPLTIRPQGNRPLFLVLWLESNEPGPLDPCQFDFLSVTAHESPE